MKWLFLILITLNSYASELYYKEGVNLDFNSLYLGVGVQRELFVFTEQFEVGAYTEKKNRDGRKSSPFFNYSAGITTFPKPIKFELLVGALLHRPDSVMGGVLAATHDVFLGLEDKDKKSVGFVYKHISNGGLFPPNIGRDYIMLRIGVGL